ncbi:sigma-w pathway protein ysdB [Texcoconibacillus texcoconensis]|uniref:Sigma-w pathway protein ysdB n=1 Tax=Texcoconibacillus texcoconensis TaxID=1095777 RepID=A0A840QMV9_9BACI|nr:sigma-w pathway protein ysdB [Texcoconibacillus texcoconensis]MBB5172696.1 hypothetical protein [Texcoconibacillus texcoconensis]
MTPLLFRFLIGIAISIIIYSVVKYIRDPRRSFESAYNQGRFFIYDDEENVRQNLLITYRGVLFEGKKYVGVAEEKFDVIKILIGTEETDRLRGLKKDDFYFLEKELILRYPKAKVEWRSPILEFMRQIEKQ